MKSFLILSLVLLVAAAIFLLWPAGQPEAPLPPSPPERIAVPAHDATSGAEHPLVAQAPPATPDFGLDQPLPSLAESDGRLQQLLGRLFPGEPLERFFILDHFIQRLVLLIDNLPRAELPASRLPTRPVAGTFLTSGDEEAPVIAAANAHRYAPWIALAEAAAPRQVVTVYVHLYPLFQQAYEELGYPGGYFNDRLIAVIDHLLATPEVSAPVHLVRPKVFYLFADPELEARSAGQKLLLRIGPDHAARVKALLRSYRQELRAVSREGVAASDRQRP
ncbi:DUF3014 domain-containing protein [Desulfuromonas carbonis]|uniref:DUF3014 domain-containing protein n=1 Tax=Desulfuromonas sp. DDH964 TaxID=1823759 RepID=UPI00078DE794|nr:DUF3014 domain-containing protein [Desulfuromonas sp. DDH964]AMV73282.1 hypothetical protein DBW_2973 [Desulfuromonas sp. DDH964]